MWKDYEPSKSAVDIKDKNFTAKVTLISIVLIILISIILTTFSVCVKQCPICVKKTI